MTASAGQPPGGASAGMAQSQTARLANRTASTSCPTQNTVARTPSPATTAAIVEPMGDPESPAGGYGVPRIRSNYHTVEVTGSAPECKGRLGPHWIVAGAGGAPTTIWRISPTRPTGTPTTTAAAVLTTALLPELRNNHEVWRRAGAARQRSTCGARGLDDRCASLNRGAQGRLGRGEGMLRGATLAPRQTNPGEEQKYRPTYSTHGISSFRTRLSPVGKPGPSFIRKDNPRSTAGSAFKAPRDLRM